MRRWNSLLHGPRRCVLPRSRSRWPRLQSKRGVENELRKYLGSKVYDTVIPRSIRLSEAPSHGQPGVIYDRVNRGSKAYMALAVEFLARSGK